MRRVVVTPTFAAGLGVVVAAVLAYPMRTVFNYAAPPGATDCKMAGCGVSSQTGGHTASGPTSPLTTHGPGATHSGGSTSQGNNASSGGGGQTAATDPQLSYQTSSKAHGGFDGTIVIAFKPKFEHQHWRLRFSYPSARILRVWAGSDIHIQHSRHSALVASLDSQAHGNVSRLVLVSIEVAGRAGPPLQCIFNGHGCHFGGQHTGQGGQPTGQHGSTGAQGHKPKGGPKPARSPKPKSSHTHKPAAG